MKRLAVLIGALLTACGAFAAAAPTDLASHHMRGGFKCEICHVKQGAVPRQGDCLKCHGGSYKALGEATKVEPNPHFNHYGDRDCTSCHSGHKKSTLSCQECHRFKTLKTPYS